MAPQSLCSQLWERGGRQLSLEFSLKCLQTLMTSLLMADCSKFLPQWGERSVADPGKPCHRYSQCWGRWWLMNEGVVDQEVQRQAVERQAGRPSPVHGHTGTPARWVCMLFAPAHEANADGKAAEWCGRVDWTGRRVEPLHSWPSGDDLAGTTGYRPMWHFWSRVSSAPTQQWETGRPSETANDECYVTASEYRSSVRQFVW